MVLGKKVPKEDTPASKGSLPNLLLYNTKIMSDGTSGGNTEPGELNRGVLGQETSRLQGWSPKFATYVHKSVPCNIFQVQSGHTVL